MIRRAFTMRLKPGALAEYKHHHDNVWPELQAEIARSGIATITTFQRDLDLFLISEIENEQAWDRLWNSEVHKRWAKVMEPLMRLRDDGIVDAGPLVEIFRLESAAPTAARRGKSAKRAASKPAKRATKAKPAAKKARSSTKKSKPVGRPSKKKKKRK